MRGAKMNIPSVKEAECLIEEAGLLNPGPWVNHSKVTGSCAKRIADKCVDLNADHAYVLGLLHDIGRRAGDTDERHIIDGYDFMNGMGYHDCARICLTHSFPYKNSKAYSGKDDCNEKESKFITMFLDTVEYDDYDKLIQLCDAISLPSGPTNIEKRLIDVTMRRGFNDFTILKWKSFFQLKEYFDTMTKNDIYELIYVDKIK
jgi:hypothetical protein